MTTATIVTSSQALPAVSWYGDGILVKGNGDIYTPVYWHNGTGWRRGYAKSSDGGANWSVVGEEAANTSPVHIISRHDYSQFISIEDPTAVPFAPYTISFLDTSDDTTDTNAPGTNSSASGNITPIGRSGWGWGRSGDPNDATIPRIARCYVGEERVMGTWYERAPYMQGVNEVEQSLIPGAGQTFNTAQLPHFGYNVSLGTNSSADNSLRDCWETTYYNNQTGASYGITHIPADSIQFYSNSVVTGWNGAAADGTAGIPRKQISSDFEAPVTAAWAHWAEVVPGNPASLRYLGLIATATSPTNEYGTLSIAALTGAYRGRAFVTAHNNVGTNTDRCDVVFIYQDGSATGNIKKSYYDEAANTWSTETLLTGSFKVLWADWDQDTTTWRVVYQDGTAIKYADNITQVPESLLIGREKFVNHLLVR